MKQFILAFIGILGMLSASAQAVFHPVVKIEFEKTVYARQLYKDMEPEWYERIKDRVPELSLSYFDFTGDSLHSIYKPGREVPQDPRAISFFNSANVVYNNYRERTTVVQKPVFEEVFLVQDSLLKIKWKLTADKRVIAGYECRKAVGIIDDSIAVFAFYTDEILVSGGPETVNGLPGMILGLGMPRIHTTWFATRVETNGVNMTPVQPATKGKKVDRKTLLLSIEKVLKSWGNYGKNMVFNYVI